MPSVQSAAAMLAGADYVEPTIVGNLVQEDGVGGWERHPGYYAPDNCPSFAILFPGHVKLSDPAVPAHTVTDYLEAVFPIIAAAGSAGAKVVFGSGAARTIPSGTDRVAAEDRFAAVLRETRDVAARHGLVVLLEPLNAGETNLLHTIEECAQFLDSHAIEDVPIVADLYHIMREGEPLSTVTALGARIGHAHIADTGRTPPGQGDWPLSHFLRALAAGGYAGSVSIECTWSDITSELAPALEHLRNLV
ncbi:MAG: sugar phosphate isomerase/epimerase family protein [Propionibacteriaceae bacterium]